MRLFLIFAAVYAASADLTDVFGDVANSLKDEVADIEDSIKTSAKALEIGAKSVINVGTEAGSDSVETIFDVKPLPRVPVPQLIEKEGYPVESHYLVTSDGYILNLFRIPHGISGKNLNKVVYLQHGLMAGPSDWVLFGAKHGLAYRLADEGYDVWLGSVRGNTYSRNHTILNPDTDSKFWMFSWHEIGIIDIPAMIDYILKETGHESLYHVGHSQGTTSFYVMASMRPDYNAKVKHHISLAPIAFMDHLVSPLVRIMSLNYLALNVALDAIGQYEFLPNSGFLNILSDAVCSEGIGKVLCKNALFAVCGFSPKQLNASSLPLIMAHYPAGASTRQLIHYGQEVVSKKFCQFDFGILKNKAHYHQLHPLDYDLSKITAPVSLIYGANDWLAAVVDVQKLAEKLVNLNVNHLVSIPTWNHLDFLFGNSAPSVVYEKVVDILAKN